MTDAAQSSEDLDDWAADGETPQAEEPESVEETEAASDDTADDDDDGGSDEVEAIPKREYEELKGRYADLEHRYKSDEGRVASMRKQIADLEARLEETRKNVPQEPVEPESEDWSEFKELYPKAAEQLVRQMEQARQQPQPERAAWDAVMDAARPGWRDAVNTTEFSEWLGQQPPEWQQLAQTPDGFAAMQVYDRYRGHVDGRRKAGELQAQRKQRLESAATPGGTRSKPPPNNDPLAGWAAD